MTTLKQAITDARAQVDTATAIGADGVTLSLEVATQLLNAATQFEQRWVEAREAVINDPRGTPMAPIPPRDGEA
jgi:hypothetical protein